MAPSPQTVRIAVLASLLAVTILAGCSSSDDASTETGDETTSTTAAPESTTTSAPEESTTSSVAPVATTSVAIEDYAFGPPAIRVAVGDTVTWTNADDFKHTTTSDTDVWDSGPIEPGAAFSQTFAEAGTFAYFCNIHNYMEGQVVVE